MKPDRKDWRPLDLPPPDVEWLVDARAAIERQRRERNRRESKTSRDSRRDAMEGRNHERA